MTNRCGTRASDAEREFAAAVLRDAYAEGRLTLEEFRDRIGGAYSATWWSELQVLTADLPASQAAIQPAPGPGGRYQPARRPFLPLSVVAAIWLAIVAVAHATAGIPLAVLALFLLRAAWWEVPPERRTGPAPAPGSSCWLDAGATRKTPRRTCPGPPQPRPAPPAPKGGGQVKTGSRAPRGRVREMRRPMSSPRAGTCFLLAARAPRRRRA